MDRNVNNDIIIDLELRSGASNTRTGWPEPESDERPLGNLPNRHGEWEGKWAWVFPIQDGWLLCSDRVEVYYFRGRWMNPHLRTDRQGGQTDEALPHMMTGLAASNWNE